MGKEENRRQRQGEEERGGEERRVKRERDEEGVWGMLNCFFSTLVM